MGQKTTKVTTLELGKEIDEPCEKEDQHKTETMKELFTTFAEQTTMHGLARVVSPNRHFLVRCIWMVLVLSAGGWAVYNALKIILLFTTYPVVTVVDVEFENQLAFPALTICNLNLLRRSQYEDNAYMMGLHDDLSSNSTDGMLSFQYEDEQLSKIKAFLRKLPEGQLSQVGHQMNNMLLQCEYGKETCSTENFTWFFNHKYGNCYTFNKNSTAIKVTSPGPSQGLKLMLLVEEYEYMPQVQSAGMKMVLHPQDAMPFPESSGMIVSPGFLTDLALSKKVYHRAGPPYGDCASYNKEENMAVNMFTPGFGAAYSAEACINTCYQVIVVSDCGCCDPDFPCDLSKVNGHRFSSKFPASFDSSVKNCDFRNNSDAELCVQFAKAIDITTGVEVDPMEVCYKACHPQCMEDVFNYQISMASWPAETASPNLISLLTAYFNDMGQNLTVNSEFLRRNIIRVNVFFSQLNVEKAVTSPAYDWLRLLGDLGGQVSLWLGFSIITAVEICQLLGDLVCLLALKLFRTSSSGKR